MKILYAKDFVRMLEHLPEDIQRLYLSQEQILAQNWKDARLHLKKLKGKPVMFSFRITRSYRAFFYFQAPDEVVLYAIGHRKDIYRNL